MHYLSILLKKLFSLIYYFLSHFVCDYTVSPRKKRAPTKCVPFYKFCFEEGCYIQIIKIPHLLASTYKEHVDSFVVMTSNVHVDERPLLQLFFF